MRESDRREIVGKVHSVETCGTVDGPGIRYVVFMQGCPLRCMYCHNPDTWKINSPTALIKTVGEIMADVDKYRSYFRFSGGGITLSGGEPLLQADFAAELFAACRDSGIHTVLDTCGDVELTAEVKAALQLTDLVLLDIKSGNADTYRRVTGGDLERVRTFARYLSDSGTATQVRFVLVPDLTDNSGEIRELAAFLATLHHIESAGVLPFHQLGAFKWEKSGLDYKLGGTRVPSEAEVAEVKRVLDLSSV
jgi:pyruvate formate lyase activating enzyme